MSKIKVFYVNSILLIYITLYINSIMNQLYFNFNIIYLHYQSIANDHKKEKIIDSSLNIYELDLIVKNFSFYFGLTSICAVKVKEKKERERERKRERAKRDREIEKDTEII